MKPPRNSGPGLHLAAAAGALGGRERLAFNLGGGTVPGRAVIEAALTRENGPSFATAVYAEPRDWGYFGLLAFTAVLLLRPQDHFPALRPLHLAELCALIGIAPMLLHRFARRRPTFRVTPETTGLVVFGAAILASVPMSIWPGGAIQVFFDSYLKLLVVVVLMLNTLTTPKRLDQITWLILLCCGYIASRAVFDYARGVNLVEGNRLAGPVNGIFGNPNDLALNMVVFLPVAVIIAMTPRNSNARRLVALGIAGLMLATIAFTKSRSGFVGFGVMFVVLVILGSKIRRGFGVAAIAAVLAVAPLMPTTFWARMASITDDQKDKEEFTGTRETRRDLMVQGIAAFLEYPLTGVGAGQFVAYNPPGRKQPWRETHNALIQVAAETGIVGLLAFSFLIFRAATATRQTRRMLAVAPRGQPDPLHGILAERDRRMMFAHTVAMTAGLAGWFTCALFASVAFNWTFYYVLALIMAAREMTRDRLKAGLALAPLGRAKTVSVPSARHAHQLVSGGGARH